MAASAHFDRPLVETGAGTISRSLPQAALAEVALRSPPQPTEVATADDIAGRKKRQLAFLHGRGPADFTKPDRCFSTSRM